MKKNIGQTILKNAKKLIPGGNQLLSKRSEMFLPDYWPNYYKKSSGCEIWDLENKKYYDFAGMGVTACSLGYANKKINSAIINSLVMYGSVISILRCLAQALSIRSNALSGSRLSL